MFYTVYKTTNLLNGKIYIGSHKTKDLDDNYLGSGKYLKRAIKKYGLQNFRKEILYVFESSEEMFSKERELVVIGPETYNLKEGGSGGFDYINQVSGNGNKSPNRNKLNERQKRSATLLKFYAANPGILKTPEQRMRAKAAGAIGTAIWTGSHHSEDAKKAIGAANSKHQKGSGNSMYGMMWITNGVLSTRIGKTDLIPEGFRKGRVQK